MTKNEGKTSYEVEPDTEILQLKTFADVQAFLLFDDDMAQESDDDVFEAGEDMEEDTQADEEEHHSPQPYDQETQESTSDFSPDLKKFDNILPLTKRKLAAVSYADLKAAIEGYYEENIDHMEQTNKVIDAAMNSLDKNNIARGDLLIALNRVNEALNAIQDAVKEHLTLYKKVIEATKAYTKNSNDLLTLIKNFDFQGLQSFVASLQAIATSQEKHLAELAKSSTSIAWNLGSRMITIELSQATIQTEVSSQARHFGYQIHDDRDLSVSKGQSSAPSSSVPQTTLAITVGPTNVRRRMSNKLTLKNLILTLRGSMLLWKKNQQIQGKAFVIDDQPEVQKKLVSASKEVRPDLDAPILVPYEINRKILQLTEEHIQAYMDKEENIKKATEEAKMFEMIKTEVIKVVQEEAEKIGLDPKKIISVKAGEKFKKAQDAEHQVLKIEHSQKAKRVIELRRKRVEQYMWTMSNRLKPEPITDVKIHPKTKPVVITVYRNNDKRNFDVHNPFKFADFGITELDELGPIIEKKKNTIVKDLMEFLSKRYQRLKKIPEELGIQSALPSVPKQAPSVSSQKKRKHMELEPEIKVPGLECNRSLPDGVPFVNNKVIEEPEYVIFFTDVFGDQAFQRWDDIHKVGVDSLVSYLVMTLMVKTPENARFGLKLRKLIAEHPDQQKL
ncbi:hypothetical protein Tco_0140171 [Tanacetum coccineum]